MMNKQTAPGTQFTADPGAVFVWRNKNADRREGAAGLLKEGWYSGVWAVPDPVQDRHRGTTLRIPR